MIRKAKISDLVRMGQVAGEFYASSRFLQGFDLERFAALWSPLLESGAGVIFVVDQDAGIQGAFGAVKHAEPYSGRPVAAEMFWFVRPEYRGAGLALFRAFEQWATEQGCVQLRMVHLVDSMPEKLDRLYRRWGYQPAEVLYVKEIQT